MSESAKHTSDVEAANHTLLEEGTGPWWQAKTGTLFRDAIGPNGLSAVIRKVDGFVGGEYQAMISDQLHRRATIVGADPAVLRGWCDITIVMIRKMDAAAREAT